jgi:hypothetical protein
MSEQDGQIEEYANSKNAVGVRVWIDKTTTEDFVNKYMLLVIAEDGARFEPMSYEPSADEESFVFEYKNYRAVPSTGGGALFILEYTAEEDSLEFGENGWAWNLNFKEVAYYKPDGWNSVRQITETNS